MEFFPPRPQAGRTARDLAETEEVGQLLRRLSQTAPLEDGPGPVRLPSPNRCRVAEAGRSPIRAAASSSSGTLRGSFLRGSGVELFPQLVVGPE